MRKFCKDNDMALMIMATDEKDIVVSASGSDDVLASLFVNALEQNQDLREIIVMAIGDEKKEA